jgi:hypothetical protein
VTIGQAAAVVWEGRCDCGNDVEGICTFDAHDFGGHLWLPIDHRRYEVENQATPVVNDDLFPRACCLIIGGTGLAS